MYHEASFRDVSAHPIPESPHTIVVGRVEAAKNKDDSRCLPRLLLSPPLDCSDLSIQQPRIVLIFLLRFPDSDISHLIDSHHFLLTLQGIILQQHFPAS